MISVLEILIMLTKVMLLLYFTKKKTGDDGIDVLGRKDFLKKVKHVILEAWKKSSQSEMEQTYVRR